MSDQLLLILQQDGPAEPVCQAAPRRLPAPGHEGADLGGQDAGRLRREVRQDDGRTRTSPRGLQPGMMLFNSKCCSHVWNLGLILFHGDPSPLVNAVVLFLFVWIPE